MILLYGAMPTEIAWFWFFLLCLWALANIAEVAKHIPALLGFEQVDLDSLPDKPTIQKPVQKVVEKGKSLELEITTPNLPKPISEEIMREYRLAKLTKPGLERNEFLKSNYPVIWEQQKDFEK